MGTAFHRYADFSDERRATVLSLINEDRFRNADISDEARLMYAVSGLVCNEVGVITKRDMHRAMADPSVVQCAQTLLREAGY